MPNKTGFAINRDAFFFGLLGQRLNRIENKVQEGPEFTLAAEYTVVVAESVVECGYELSIGDASGGLVKPAENSNRKQNPKRKGKGRAKQ